jgi:hypothetical protein
MGLCFPGRKRAVVVGKDTDDVKIGRITECDAIERDKLSPKDKIECLFFFFQALQTLS